MTEISHIFASLIDTDGKINIPGLSDEVDPVTDAEKNRYENIDFSLEGLVLKKCSDFKLLGLYLLGL